MTVPSPPPAESRQGWSQSSTCRAVEAIGNAEGVAYGQVEAMARGLARLLRRQAKEKFVGENSAGLAVLEALADGFACAELERLAEGILLASNWEEWLAGVEAPPPAPGVPDYARNQEIDVELTSPSIDTYMKTKLVSGGEALIHLRIQKWYQPDLDRHLFLSSRKLERQYGCKPMVCVILMWPACDGPGVTGRYQERDNKGGIKETFTYLIRRAWEMEPEEVMHGPGSMLLAPLARGARERMAEIIQMMKEGLARDRTTPDVQLKLWEAVYWSMGLVCDLDEVHIALGDVLPDIQRSPGYLAAKGYAFQIAYENALREGPATAARALILRQGASRFGPSPGAEESLAAITAIEDLEGRALRVPTAPDWPALLS